MRFADSQDPVVADLQAKLDQAMAMINKLKSSSELGTPLSQKPPSSQTPSSAAKTASPSPTETGGNVP